jgi:hypothetical protein
MAATAPFEYSTGVSSLSSRPFPRLLLPFAVVFRARCVWDSLCPQLNFWQPLSLGTLQINSTLNPSKIPHHHLAQWLQSVNKTPTGFGGATQTIARLLGMAMQTSITLSTTFPARQSYIQPAMLHIDTFLLSVCLIRFELIYWHLLIFAVTDLDTVSSLSSCKTMKRRLR